LSRTNSASSSLSGYTSITTSSKSTTPIAVPPVNWAHSSTDDYIPRGSLGVPPSIPRFSVEVPFGKNQGRFVAGRVNGLSSSGTESSARRRDQHRALFTSGTETRASRQAVTEVFEDAVSFTDSEEPFGGRTLRAANSAPPSPDTIRSKPVIPVGPRSTVVSGLSFGIPPATVTPSKVVFPSTFSFVPSLSTSQRPRPMSGNILNISTLSMSDLRVESPDEEKLQAAEKQWEEARRELAMRKAAVMQAKREYDAAAKAEAEALQEYFEVRGGGGGSAK